MWRCLNAVAACCMGGFLGLFLVFFLAFLKIYWMAVTPGRDVEWELRVTHDGLLVTGSPLRSKIEPKWQLLENLRGAHLPAVWFNYSCRTPQHCHGIFCDLITLMNNSCLQLLVSKRTLSLTSPSYVLLISFPQILHVSFNQQDNFL